ncbi:thioredoxin domain-containing protein [Armatimonas sp.]|uniref:thioredoxin family protein n=1 Tax=Armatimonas sp. TaxID=1872638 RepID=UPI00286C8AB8|nr:thioredoxin domain-containing protein [Armatimonas sp.]
MDETGFIAHWPGGAEATNCDAFDEDVLESPLPVLVEFWAARCSACLRLAPQLEALAQERQGRLRVFTLNVDEELPAAVRYEVLAIPALLLFADGQEVTRWVGSVDMAAVRSQLTTLSQSSASPL